MPGSQRRSQRRRRKNSASPSSIVLKSQHNPLLEEQVDIFFGNVKNYFMVVPNYNLLGKESSPNKLYYSFIKKTILDLYKSLKLNNVEYNVFIKLLCIILEYLMFLYWKSRFLSHFT